MTTSEIRYLFKKGWLIFAAMLAIALTWTVQSVVADSPTQIASSDHLVTVYDRGQEKSLVTKAATVGDALKEADVQLLSKDKVEPSTDTPLLSKNYHINVYRARLVLIDDAGKHLSVVTAAQSPESIMKLAGLTLYDEDQTESMPIDNVLAAGAGLKLKVNRATVFKFDLYGKTFTARSQAKTIGQMLADKGVKLGPKDGVTPGVQAPLQAGMLVKVYRNGKHTITVKEAIKTSVKQIFDDDRPQGYKAVKTAGSDGAKEVTYQIVMKHGKQVSKKKIASVTTKKPVTKVVVVGVKAGAGLSKSKGVYFSKDSSGVSHRETYYDLPMNVVMRACGGGKYTIRSDGAKVDKDGYVLVAANLHRYPRCSVVHTSIGPGKVYDTGGFISHHPDGFDLATDWTNNNGR